MAAWRKLCSLILGLLLLALAGEGARAGDLELCNDARADPDARITACTQVIEHPSAGTNIPAVYSNRGVAKLRIGDLDDAIADFTSALNLNPRFVDAWKNRGIARYMQDNYDAAIADFSRALRLNPMSADLYNGRGAALYKKREYDHAIADFDKAIALDPNYKKAFTNRRVAIQSKLESSAERRERETEHCAKGFSAAGGTCQPHRVPAAAPAPPRRKILETGYGLLKDIGGEERGYGLYSYAILVNNNDRSAKFLKDVFGDKSNTTPPIEETAAHPSQANVLYITLKRNKAKEWSKRLRLDKEAALRAYANNFYDYKVSRTLLNHLCVSPAKEIKEVCEGDLSRGPYIFSYATPASNVSPVPPPFLFMDLSDVHERAFPTIIAAFKEQVQREDISDRAKIDTLRLKVLSIILTAADWLVPVQKAMANIVYSSSGHPEKDKQ